MVELLHSYLTQSRQHNFHTLPEHQYKNPTPKALSIRTYRSHLDNFRQNALLKLLLFTKAHTCVES